MANAGKKSEKGRGDQEAPTAEILRPLKVLGSRIGQFEVEREIGRGGMGVVYLARDTKLDRCVAVKSLPRESMDNPEVRGRLTREAKVLASLNHPNIATIHDIVEEEDGSPFLVLEYVPGQTLAERITSSKLKPQKALSIAQQIAEAVSAAHEHNVVHRDLKPANIKITAEGRIKVLDFGLAKIVCAEAVNQPIAVTQPGRIMGTPTYMSPEQARGQESDERCDIWSFGCILYEMLTGKVAFKGETVSDILAAVLDREPDWQALPKSIPANVRILLRRCLKKDPQRRLHDIADAAIEISETLSGALEGLTLPGDVAAISRFLRREVILAAAVCSIAAALMTVGVFICFRRPVTGRPPVVSRFPICVPANKPIYTGTAPNRFLAISPDGTRLVYVGQSHDTGSELHVRSLDNLRIRTIGGTRNAHNPFFSPDGRWVAFFTDKQLKKVSLAGGEPLTLLEGIQFGEAAFGSWAGDGTIVFTVCTGNHGLQRIPDDGSRPPEMLLARVSDIDQAYYCYPQVLPSGSAILYSKVYSGDSRTSSIEAFLPRTRKRQVVLDNATYVAYVNSGHLILVRDKVLMAVPFDVGRLRITGDPVPLASDDVGFDWTDQTPQITVSTNGTMACISQLKLRRGELVWVDRSGSSTPLAAEDNAYEGPRLSPGGQLIAVGIRSQQDRNIRVITYNVEHTRFDMFMTEGESNYAQWSPDGTQIAFWGKIDESGQAGLFCRSVGAGGSVKKLAGKPVTGAFLHPYSWSQSLLACTVLDPNTREDIWMLDMDGAQEPKPVICSEHKEYNPALSPDGRWLAYVSDESGQLQIYVRSYPDLKLEGVIRTLDATNPVWSHDGRQLYYVSGNRMMVAGFTSGSRFPIGEPEVVFESSDLVVSGGRLVRNYDVSESGQFLMVKWHEDPEDQLVVVQNWFAELERLAPTQENN